MPFLFQIEVDSVGGRKIKGVASDPLPDSENEIITKDAMRDALARFMRHPIMHVAHTERPIGIFTKAELDEQGKVHIEGEVFNTPDCDDVWKAIQDKTYTKWSIYGRRKMHDGPCHLPPGSRGSPCITKGFDLWSISLVGDNAINQRTYVEIAKANLPDGCFKNLMQNWSGIYKSGDDNLIKGESMVPEPVKDQPIIETPPADPPIVKGGATEERLEKMETSIDLIVKAVEGIAAAMPDIKKSEEPKVEATSPDIDTIVKARVETELGDIKKSFSDLSAIVTDLKKTVDAMGDEVIRKGGNVVVLQNPSDEGYNPQIRNASIIGV